MKKKLIQLEVSCDQMCDLRLLHQELKQGIPTADLNHYGNPIMVVRKNRDSERQLEIVTKLIASAKEI